MLNSEKLAIAAHLHVLLRRKTGRVTDTEWMASNTDYATEVVRFARESARKDGHADLEEWAGKLEAAMLPTPVAPPIASRLLDAVSVPLAASRKAPPPPGPDAPPPEERYIRGIR
jgi:hypothetical protein